METVETKRRWKIWHIIGFGMLGVAVMGGGILALVLSLTRPVVVASDAFMATLRDGNYEAAYARTTPALQTEMGSPQQMEQRLARLRPASWSWNSRSIRNGIGEVQGTATFANGGSGQAQIQFEKIGDEWRVTWFRLDPP